MLRIGLTGGIGSGKSTVAAVMQDHGAGIVDTDEIARALTAAAGAAIPQIEAVFGRAALAADGSLDRALMRDRVFRDPAAKRQLESILHPMIRAESDTRAQALTAPYLVFAVPLLAESPDWRTRVDRILVVDCSLATQLERLRSTRALDRAESMRIIAQQADRAARLALADDVIFNDGSLAQLIARAEQLHTHYRRLAESGSMGAL